MTLDGVDETTLLIEAKSGDDAAFGRLVEPYRGEVQAHCYRMLGSLHDAEDVLQESLVRAWKGLGTFDGRGPIRPWLHRIATNRCLTHLEKRGRRELPADLTPGAPLTEVAWLEPYPDRLLGPEAGVEQREGVELAFVAALQHLTASQRAALLLREVLGFSAAEVADLLDTSVPAVNSALQRARGLLAERRPAVSQQATLRTLGDDTIKDLADRYAAAWHANDVDAIVAMLAEDATFSMPPLVEWFRGPDDIRGFLLSGPMPYRWRLVPCQVNGQLGFASYWWEDDRNAFVFVALDVVTVEERGITEVVAFLSRDLWKECGLPMSFADAPGCTG